MQPDKIKADLKQKIAEAKELSAHHKRELDKNPKNAIFRIRYNGFKGFIEQLEMELDELEQVTNKRAKDIVINLDISTKSRFADEVKELDTRQLVEMKLNLIPEMQNMDNLLKQIEILTQQVKAS